MREQAVERPLDRRYRGAGCVGGAIGGGGIRGAGRAGGGPGGIRVERRVHVRYDGTSAALVVNLADADAMRAAFTATHQSRFGFTTPDRGLVIEAIEVEAVSPGEAVSEPVLPARTDGEPAVVDTVQIWTGGADHRCRRLSTARRCWPATGSRGPALVREANATTVVEPGWTAEVTAANHMILRRTAARGRSDRAARKSTPSCSSLFNNLFMNVAEQTGVVLANTSLSVNIKERLGFLLRDLRCDRRAGGQRAACAGASGRDGRERAHGAAAPRHATLRPGDVVALNNPYQRRHASAGHHRHHPGVRRGRAGDPVLRRQPRPSRRCRRHHARQHAAAIPYAGGRRRRHRRLPARRAGPSAGGGVPRVAGRGTLSQRAART